MIIKGEVIRQKSSPQGTPGRLTLENGFSCDTLELQWMNNERGKSCTVAGVDHGRVWFSPTLIRLVVRYDDRNERRDCLIHNGNWASEVPGEMTQIHGCTEVGRGYGVIKRPGMVRAQWGILNSGATLAQLVTSLRDPADPNAFHEVEITYRWADGCQPSVVEPEATKGVA